MQSASVDYSSSDIEVKIHKHSLSRVAFLCGRILFSLIFIFSGFTHFSAETISYAASQGVPYANFLVPFSGVLAFLGGTCILTGYKVRLGATLLVMFLIPITFQMHNFWVYNDPGMRQIQMIMFMKNISMLGAALYISYFGAGPFSVDNRAVKRVR